MPHSGREQNPVHWRCPYLLEPWPTRQTPGGAGNREHKETWVEIFQKGKSDLLEGCWVPCGWRSLKLR